MEEEGHRFVTRGSQVYRENRLYRGGVSRRTGDRAERTLLADNSFPVLYPVDLAQIA